MITTNMNRDIYPSLKWKTKGVVFRTIEILIFGLFANSFINDLL